jgi:hypothetical protein
MAYYLNNEREKDARNAYRIYQDYLQSLKDTFPSSAFALGTAEWYQNPSDRRCPHDAWLESLPPMSRDYVLQPFQAEVHLAD